MLGKITLFMLCCITALVMGCSRQQSDFTSGRWIDLSYDFSAETIFWPTGEGFIFEKGFDGIADNGFYYAANSFSTAEHGGTHIDAPVHFAQGRMTVDELSIEQLTGPAAVIDVSAKALNDRDYLIQIDDIISWESAHGRLPENVILLFRTGFGEYWPDPKMYLGTDKKGPEAIPELHFPGISQEAAQWLADNRSIDAIGIDTASIDYGQSKTDEAHRILYELNIPGLENIANLDMLPETGAFIIALPMKIKGGSGGPLRITAFIPD